MPNGINVHLGIDARVTGQETFEQGARSAALFGGEIIALQRKALLPTTEAAKKMALGAKMVASAALKSGEDVATLSKKVAAGTVTELKMGKQTITAAANLDEFRGAALAGVPGFGELQARIAGFGTSTRLTSAQVSTAAADLGVMIEKAKALGIGTRETIAALEEMQRALQRTTKELRIGEVKTKDMTGSQFGMMKHTENATYALNTMSAAAHGTMLGMSLARGQIMGAAFSIIFLRFSVPKLVFVFGGLAVALIWLMKLCASFKAMLFGIGKDMPGVAGAASRLADNFKTWARTIGELGLGPLLEKAIKPLMEGLQELNNALGQLIGSFLKTKPVVWALGGAAKNLNSILQPMIRVVGWLLGAAFLALAGPVFVAIAAFRLLSEPAIWLWKHCKVLAMVLGVLLVAALGILTYAAILAAKALLVYLLSSITKSSKAAEASMRIFRTAGRVGLGEFGRQAKVAAKAIMGLVFSLFRLAGAIFHTFIMLITGQKGIRLYWKELWKASVMSTIYHKLSSGVLVVLGLLRAAFIRLLAEVLALIIGEQRLLIIQATRKQGLLATAKAVLFAIFVDRTWTAQIKRSVFWQDVLALKTWLSTKALMVRNKIVKMATVITNFFTKTVWANILAAKAWTISLITVIGILGPALLALGLMGHLIYQLVTQWDKLSVACKIAFGALAALSLAFAVVWVRAMKATIANTIFGKSLITSVKWIGVKTAALWRLIFTNRIWGKTLTSVVVPAIWRAMVALKGMAAAAWASLGPYALVAAAVGLIIWGLIKFYNWVQEVTGSLSGLEKWCLIIGSALIVVAGAVAVLFGGTGIGLAVAAVIALCGAIALLIVWLVGGSPGGLVDAVKAVGNAFSWLAGIPGRVWDAIRDGFGSIVDFFKSLPGKIGDALSTLKDFIIAPFKAAINGIIWLFNQMLGFFSGRTIIPRITLPEWLPEWLGGGKAFELRLPEIPKIPTLQYGAIVRPPGAIARVGEAGPEAIIPLKGQGALAPIVVNITGNYILDDATSRRLADHVSEVILKNVSHYRQYSIRGG